MHSCTTSTDAKITYSITSTPRILMLGFHMMATVTPKWTPTLSYPIQKRWMDSKHNLYTHYKSLNIL